MLKLLMSPLSRHKYFRLTTSTICPVTKTEISPETITTPSRLVLSILAGLYTLMLQEILPRRSLLAVRIVDKGRKGSWFSHCLPFRFRWALLTDHQRCYFCPSFYKFQNWLLPPLLSSHPLLTFEELPRKCGYTGCEWQGRCDAFTSHAKVRYS